VVLSTPPLWHTDAVEGASTPSEPHAAARAEIEAVRACLGPLWPALYNVAILNLDVAEWSRAINMNPEQAAGFLAASLDVLVSFYADIEPERRGQIRSVTVSGLAPAQIHPTDA
jgi:hypothetical protein